MTAVARGGRERSALVEGSYRVPAAAAESLQSCPTLRDPIDGSPPGSPVPGILQARILEWVGNVEVFGPNSSFETRSGSEQGKHLSKVRAWSELRSLSF